MFDSLEFKSLSFAKACFLAALSTLYSIHSIHYFTGSSPQCRAPLLFLYLFLSLSLSHTLAPTRTDSLPTLSESLLSVCAASLAALELRLAARGFCCCCFISSGGCTHHAAAACCCRLECPSPSILGLPGRPRQQAGLISRRHVTIAGWHARGCEECGKRGRNVAAGYHNHRLVF